LIHRNGSLAELIRLSVFSIRNVKLSSWIKFNKQTFTEPFLLLFELPHAILLQVFHSLQSTLYATPMAKSSFFVDPVWDIQRLSRKTQDQHFSWLLLWLFSSPTCRISVWLPSPIPTKCTFNCI
jgi:hypothetical protein